MLWIPSWIVVKVKMLYYLEAKHFCYIKNKHIILEAEMYICTSLLMFGLWSVITESLIILGWNGRGRGVKLILGKGPLLPTLTSSGPDQ